MITFTTIFGDKATIKYGHKLASVTINGELFVTKNYKVGRLIDALEFLRDKCPTCWRVDPKSVQSRSAS